MALFEKGKSIYEKLKSKIEKKHKGEVIAIEPKSKKYVIGKDELEAALMAVQKFPGKAFAFFRIGYPVLHKLRSIKIKIYG